MAKIVPTIEQIYKLKQRPTAGEKALLNFLHQLNDEYTVYFQPFLNGNLPDVVILHPTRGLLIIEVKDWDLSKYEIRSGKWFLKKHEHTKPIRSPFKQVEEYIKNIYSFVSGFVEQTIFDSRKFGYAKKVVYFHNETETSATHFCKDCNNYNHWVDILGYDSLSVERIRKLSYFNKHVSHEFTHHYFEEFEYLFKPSMHYLRDGNEISYSKQQLKLITNKNKELKIKGVAGSGKTSVLAKRAVNAHKRTNQDVLILTYNITLRNFIRDKISQVRDDFPWSAFHINNYHNFILTMANEYEVDKVDFNDISIFDGIENIRKYDAIYIDEVQDYPLAWQMIIKKYFLASKGELVIFGDEKQTLYEIGLMGNEIQTVIENKPWMELDESFRFSTDVGELALRFSDEFFINKYSKMNMIIQSELSLAEGMIKRFKKLSFSILSLEQTAKFIIEYAREQNIPLNDIVILGRYHTALRFIDYYIRTNYHLGTTRTFESQEAYETLLEKFPHENGRYTRSDNKDKFDRKIREIRKNQRIAFQMNRGTIKISTIHSFKGWEGENVFLLNERLNNDREQNKCKGNNDELFFVGITRCITNLIILDINSPSPYKKFLEKNNDIIHNQYFKETIDKPM